MVASQKSKLEELRLITVAQSTALAKYQAELSQITDKQIEESLQQIVYPHLDFLRDSHNELEAKVEANKVDADAKDSKLDEILSYLRKPHSPRYQPTTSHPTLGQTSPPCQAKEEEPQDTSMDEE